MVDVWEMEVRRARTWLATSERAAREHRLGVFQRVNSHMSFVDHQRALRVSQEEDEEDFGGLGFLDDVDPADMSQILQSEAMTAANGAQATTAAVTTLETAATVTAVDATLKPIEMPSHLIASPPKKTPQRYGGGAVTTAARDAGPVPKPVVSTARVAPTTLGMALSSDDNVKELMADLQLNVHVHSDTDEERKTEESTPPHSGGYAGASISAVKDKTRRAESAASMQLNTEEARGQKPQDHSSKTSNDNGAKTKPTNPVDPETVVSEMFSWVSGVRDPTVLERKEALAKRNRKRTRHFGIGSVEEQRHVQQAVKRYTQDSDSDERSPEEDNDYSPSEDIADFEPEEPVDKDELLSDDYLNSDDESLSKRRKRLRRHKKTLTTKKGTKKAAPGGKRVNGVSATNSGGSSTVETLRSDPTMADPRSSDAVKKPAVVQRLASGGRMKESAVPANGKTPTLLRRDTVGSPRNHQGTSDKGQTTAASTAFVPLSDAARASDDGYETAELPSDGDESDKENSSANAAATNGGRAASLSQPANDLADRDGEVSDTGTVDFDFDGDEPAGEQPTSISVERSEAATRSPGSDGDVSDAETVVLDEEVASDDLGLDYSDDSDHVADLGDAHGGEQPSSVPGIQQFFDYKPLKLRKTAVEKRKTIPVHAEADFVAKKVSSGATKANDGATAGSANSVGSNGLRPTKPRSLETSVTMKGKHPVVRRAIKVIENGTPSQGSNSTATHHVKTNGGTELLPKQRYDNAIRPTGSNGLRKATKSANRLEASESQDAAGDDSSARYLSYAGTETGGSTMSAPFKPSKPSKPKRPTPTVTPSRYGGGADVSAGVGVAAPSSATNGTQERQFRRDPQFSLYEALHIDGKEEDRSFMDRDAGYKRPSAFKKLQAESARTGIPLVTSKEKEPDYDRMPIPKKGISFTSGVPEPRPKTTETSSRSSKTPAKKPEKTSSSKGSRYGGDDSQSSRYKPSKDHGKSERGGKKSRDRPFEDKKRTSYYGPSTDVKTTSRSDRRRSPTPPHYGSSKRHDYKESRDKKRHGASRSPSPRSSRERDWERDRASRDKKSSKSRPRSPSPGHKRSRSDDRDGYRSEKGSRNRSASPSRDDKSSRFSSKSGCSSRDLEAREYEKSSKKQKTKEHAADPADSRQQRSDPPPSSALASFDDDNSLYISESDPEFDMELEKQEDIRFDLETVDVDLALMARRVYVTGFNPTICDEELEEIFAPFDVEVDKETKYPAIDVFTCQRTFKSRGDACVTFTTKEGALAAVEELHAKHVKSSLIGVRLMDVHTQRILNAQLEAIRDTWKCAGTRCRAEVSTWDGACPQCRRKRCFGPSHYKITRDSWLCSICFTANDKYDNACKGCGESLPETGRFASYCN